MSMQVGLEKSGSEAHTEMASAGFVTVRRETAFSGGSWAYSLGQANNTATSTRREDFIGAVFLAGGTEESAGKRGNGISIAVAAASLQVQTRPTALRRAGARPGRCSAGWCPGGRPQGPGPGGCRPGRPAA